MQIYIPKKEIMLKMMRACIAVKKPEDLWINQDVEDDDPSIADIVNKNDCLNNNQIIDQ